jgi:hypothetical protein
MLPRCSSALMASSTNRFVTDEAEDQDGIARIGPEDG